VSRSNPVRRSAFLRGRRRETPPSFRCDLAMVAA
jgi:hypothetical protein